METRLAPRIPVNFNVVASIDRKTSQAFSLFEGNRFRINVVDLSTGGAGAASRYFLPTGLWVILAFPGKVFGSGKFTRVSAQVRYCKYIKHSSYKCGLKFAGLNPRQKAGLEKLLANLEKRSEPRFTIAI
jgi:c-di-GMP-binding flagellar brake protein YcgR